ncbi:MAG: magnesium transporter [Betaproteobacteria bacterium]|nr:magnesium transporter [Betaproteobacteria bacterium]
MSDNVQRLDKRPRQEDAVQEIVASLRERDLSGLVVRHDLGRTPEFVADLLDRPEVHALRGQLDRLHPADVALVLEALPLDERLLVWELVRAERDGEILLEVSDAVRESLIRHIPSEELVAAAENLDADEIADLAPDLPEDVLADLFRSLPVEEREQLRAAMSFEEDAVGALMDFDLVTVRPDVSLETVLRYLRRFDELPDQTDQIFVIDRAESLLGTLPLHRLLVNDPEREVHEVMVEPVLKLMQDDKAEDAAKAFERYDLVSAPVLDAQGKLVGRVTVNEVLDLVRAEGEEDLLAQAGLREEEDVFASAWRSFQNRWTWLAINLVTAFVASRVIGIFEHSIEKLVALAALMPIVAGIGGNSGNQTITMIVRAAAVGSVSLANGEQLLMKEIKVSALNGLIWGGVLGLVAYLLYSSWALALVMTAAMSLNLTLAAIAGVMVPMTLLRLGRDPALGSSVLITAITDSGGFFIFLGLATVFLL